MLSLPLPVKIFWCLTPADMRRSFDGLARMVEEELGRDPLSGHLFVFCSRRRDRVKLLYFERGGLAIWYKRLEQGTFAVPRAAADGRSVELTAAELAMLLDGVELASVRRRPRYERPARDVVRTYESGMTPPSDVGYDVLRTTREA